MQNVKSLAKSHEAYNGAVRFWMIPWHTVQLDVVIETMSRLLPRTDWSTHTHIFTVCYGTCIDIEFDLDKAPEDKAHEVKTLHYFWQARNGNVAETWNLFQQIVPANAAVEWDAAYSATRDASLSGGSIATAPPAEKKSASKPSKKNSKDA